EAVASASWSAGSPLPLLDILCCPKAPEGWRTPRSGGVSITRTPTSCLGYLVVQLPANRGKSQQIKLDQGALKSLQGQRGSSIMAVISMKGIHRPVLFEQN